MSSSLTEKEKKFLIALYDLPPNGFKNERQRMMAAAKLAGYSEGVSPYSIVKKPHIRNEIINMSVEYALVNLPRAMKLIAEVIDGSESRAGVKDAIKCVELFAGYAGLVKQDKSAESETPSQVIIVPEKNDNISKANKGK
jgi:hypothetical protein